jgi:hypothetical protein
VQNQLRLRNRPAHFTARSELWLQTCCQPVTAPFDQGGGRFRLMGDDAGAKYVFQTHQPCHMNRIGLRHDAIGHIALQCRTLG